MATTTERLATQATEMRKDFEEMGSIAKDAAQETVGQLREEASDCYEQGRDKAHDVVLTVEKYVRERPLKSLLIASGVGLLFGRFWMRR